MRDKGHVAPAAAPAVFVPPALIRTPPRSFVLPRALSYSPALICTLLRSFVLPRARWYPPALLRTPHAPFVPACACL